MPRLPESVSNTLWRFVQQASRFFTHFILISRIAIPMALSFTFSLGVWLLSVYLAKLNDTKENEASITLTTSMLNGFMIVGISPLLALSLVASKDVGRLENAANSERQQALRDKIANVHHQGLVIGAVSMPFILSGLLFSETILSVVFQQNKAVSQIAQATLRPLSIYVPALILRLCAEQMMFSFGRSKPAMVMALSSFAIGIGAIAPLFGFVDKKGRSGIIAGYIVEAYLTATAFALYIALHPDFKDYAFFRPRNFKFHLRYLHELCVIARSIFFSAVIESAGSLLTSALAGKVGVLQQAAYSSTLPFSLLTLLMQYAFSQTANQQMLRYIGEKRYEEASHVAWDGLLTTATYVMPLPFIFAIHPHFLVQISGQQDPEMEHILISLVPILSVAILADTSRFYLLQLLRPLNDANTATLISAAGLIMGVALSYGLGLHTSLGIYGVALGYLTGALIAFVSLLKRFIDKSTPGAMQKVGEQGLLEHHEQTPLSRGSMFTIDGMTREEREGLSAALVNQA